MNINRIQNDDYVSAQVLDNNFQELKNNILTFNGDITIPVSAWATNTSQAVYWADSSGNTVYPAYYADVSVSGMTADTLIDGGSSDDEEYSKLCSQYESRTGCLRFFAKEDIPDTNIRIIGIKVGG